VFCSIQTIARSEPGSKMCGVYSRDLVIVAPMPIPFASRCTWIGFSAAVPEACQPLTVNGSQLILRFTAFSAEPQVFPDLAASVHVGMILTCLWSVFLGIEGLLAIPTRSVFCPVFAMVAVRFA